MKHENIEAEPEPLVVFVKPSNGVICGEVRPLSEVSECSSFARRSSGPGRGRDEAEIEMRWVFVVFTFGSYVFFLSFHFQVADLNT